MDKLKYIIAGTDIEKGISDNLSIVLASYFDGHLDRPEDDEENEYGFGVWSTEKTNEAIDILVSEIQNYINENYTPIEKIDNHDILCPKCNHKMNTLWSSMECRHCGYIEPCL